LHVPGPAAGLLDVRPFQPGPGRRLAQGAHRTSSSVLLVGALCSRCGARCGVGVVPSRGAGLRVGARPSRIRGTAEARALSVPAVGGRSGRRGPAVSDAHTPAALAHGFPEAAAMVEAFGKPWASAAGEWASLPRLIA